MSNHVEDDPPQTKRSEPARPPGQGKHRVSSVVRRTRLAQLGVATAAVIATIVAVIVATSASGSAPPKPRSAQAATIEQQITVLLAGIPQHANVLGRPTAPVTLEWFGDLECPICKEFALGALPSIIDKWVRGGQLMIRYRSMETATREPATFETQQVAALAAGMQDRMWNYLETFYHEQGEEDSGYVNEHYLQGLASQIPGLNLALWTEDRDDPQLASQVVADRQAAKNAHYRGTPTFLLGKSNGPTAAFNPASLTDPTQYGEAIEQLLEA
jgi:protein-disulfide isomerase